MSKIILGVDPGTAITGYGLIQEQGSALKLLDFGSIRPGKNLTPEQKYAFIFGGIEELISRFCPQEISVETQFVKLNPQSAIKLGMARGAVMIAAGRNNIPVFEYTPLSAKLAVVGHGGASKEQVQKMIQLLLQLPQIPQPQDAADALALALCHIQRRKKLCTNTFAGN